MGKGNAFAKTVGFLFLSSISAISGTIRSTTSYMPDYKSLSPELQNDLAKKFKSSRLYKLNSVDAFKNPGFNIQNLVLSLENQKEIQLELRPHDMRAPNYLSRVANRRGVRIVEKTPSKTFQAYGKSGEFKGRISLGNVSFSGFFKDEGEIYFVEPLQAMDKEADPEYLLVYRPNDIIPEDVTCGNAVGLGNTFLEEMEKISPAPAPEAAMAGCMRTEIAFAVDYSMVAQYGGIAGAENRILEVMNAVEGLYQHEDLNIKYSITEMYFEEEDMNTWGAQNDFNNNLTNLLNWARSTNGFSSSFDVSSMWFHERSGGVVGLAQLSAICSRTRGGNVIKDFSNNFMEIVVDQAHELGHNWSAPHIEGNNYIMNPTIIRDNPTWSSQTLGLISSHRDSRTCLSSCDVAPSAAFEISQNECRSEVEFVDKSIDAPKEWLWNFGDGQTSSDRNPTHSYAENGAYTVSLTASNDFGENVVTKQNAVNINAPQAPQLLNIQCEGEQALISAQGQKELKWYTSPTGGVPVYVGDSYQVVLPNTPRSYFVEDADPDGQPQLVGPSDSANGEGGFKNNGSIYMEFEIEKPLRFNSITVYSNEMGNRHFILYYNGGRIKDTVVNIGTGQFDIEFNWDLLQLGEYRFELEQNEQYITSLYRNTEGVSYPQAVNGLIRVLRNYYHATDISSTGWYIGYNWKMQEIGECASPRLAVELTPECAVAVKEPIRKLQLSNLSSLGGIEFLEIRNIKGKLLISQTSKMSAADVIYQLKLLPAEGFYFLKLVGKAGKMEGLYQAR